MMQLRGPAPVVLAMALLVFAVPASGADSWPRRFGNDQNTTDAGTQVSAEGVALSPENVTDLTVTASFPLAGNATPIIGHGLLLYGSSLGITVIDLDSGKTLIRMETPGLGIESTGTLATVTVPGDDGPREENRFYIGINSATQTLHCLNVDRILEDRATLENDDGSSYVCDGPARPFEVTASTGLLTAATRLPDAATPRKPWPLALEPPPPGLGPGLGMAIQSFHGTPLFRKGQPIRVGDTTEIRDVLFTPSMGIEPSCSGSVVWAIDAWTGEKLWQWNPVRSGDGRGAVVWFSPAMSRDGKHLYLTTGDCVDKPHIGDQSESIVSLDPETGEVQWYRQVRLVDTRDFDIGNSPTVVDVEGEDGCHLVAHIDKDGCFYAYQQEPDVPEVGEPGYDAVRPGQQRLVWRQCVARSGTTGGFDANGASFHGRWLMAQSQRPGGAGPDDNAWGFMVDACTGELVGASSDLASGYSEGAVAGGMWFIANKTNGKLQVMRAEPPFDLLATTMLPNASSGGGGPAIAGGKVYVPAVGVVVLEVEPGSGASLPEPGPSLVYDGPYAEPLGTQDLNVFGPVWPAAEVWDELVPVSPVPPLGVEVPPATETQVLAILSGLKSFDASPSAGEDPSAETSDRLKLLVDAGFPAEDALVALAWDERHRKTREALAAIPGGFEAFDRLKFRAYYEPRPDGAPPPSFLSEVWDQR